MTTFHRYVRTRYKIWPLVLKPGKSSYPLPPRKKKIERPPRASQCTDCAPVCTDRARTSTKVSGRALRVDYIAVCQNVIVRSDMFEKLRKITKLLMYNAIRLYVRRVPAGNATTCHRTGYDKHNTHSSSTSRMNVHNIILVHINITYQVPGTWYSGILVCLVSQPRK